MQVSAQPLDLIAQYRAQVLQRLEPPPDEAARYAGLAIDQLNHAGVDMTSPQYVVLVDRNPQVQAIFVIWLSVNAPPLLIGVSPVSTGRVGEYDHFETPLGVFNHSTDNPDFRAEGSKNALGFRGYGVKGLRVYDLGWQQATRG